MMDWYKRSHPCLSGMRIMPRTGVGSKKAAPSAHARTEPVDRARLKPGLERVAVHAVIGKRRRDYHQCDNWNILVADFTANEVLIQFGPDGSGVDEPRRHGLSQADGPALLAE
jgi:hypothetical protein